MISWEADRIPVGSPQHRAAVRPITSRWQGCPVLVFDLGSDVALSEISVWGYSTTNSNGASRFSLRFATAAEGTGNLGSSISINPTFHPVIGDAARQSFAFGQSVTARYIEFTCADNFYSNGG